MSLEAAARVGDQVHHTGAFAGFLAGALIGAGIALLIFSGPVGWAMLAAVCVGAGLGMAVGEILGPKLFPDTPSGPIIRGSPNIFINGKSAAYCSSDVACKDHAAQKIAEGRAVVGYNQLPASRKGDKGTCGFVVSAGSPNVFLGGALGGCGLPVGDEIPWWARAAQVVVGLIGMGAGLTSAAISMAPRMCALGIATRLGVGLLGGIGGGLLGGAGMNALADALGLDQDSTARRLMVLGGETVGGMFGGRLASRSPLGRTLAGEPIDVVTGEVVMEQTDFRLPGALPLELNRFYASGLIYGGSFGSRWADSWGQFVKTDGDNAYVHTEDGRVLYFPLPETGEESKCAFAVKFRLRITENGFRVKDEANRFRFYESKSDDHFLLSAVEDLNGNRIDFTRDASGALREVRHSGGYRLAVEGTARTIRRIELISADGSREELARYDYDQGGRLAAVYNQSGSPMRFEYDDAARLIRWEDRRGTWFAYKYDDEGRCVRTRGINEMYSGSFNYDEQTLTTAYTDSLGSTTRYTYDDDFQVVKFVDARGGEFISEYDELNNLTATVDALGSRTEFFYDLNGNLIKQTDALGGQVSTTFNEQFLPETFVDRLGNSLKREYDERGNVTKIVEPNGNFYTYELDEKGNAVRIVNSFGDDCEIEYDAKGLIVAATDWKGNKSSLKRDAKGLIRERVDPLGRKTQYEYVLIDRLAKVVLPTGASLKWEYDAEGNLINYTDGGNRIYRYEYGAFDLLTDERLPNGTRRRYRYDTEARLTAVANELGEVYRYACDENGQIVREQDFAGRILHYEYDLAGRCAKRINGAGQIIAFQYDASGRVVKQINHEGEESIYEYDASGNIVRATSADGVEIVLERNELGQITSETQSGQAIQSAFDALGRRTNRRTLRGGEIKWRYDENSLPLEMQFGATGEEFLFEYDAASRETSRRLASGLKLQKEYDALDRLTHQWAELDTNDGLARLASHLSEQKYFYDESGNPLAVHDERRGETEYEYDLLGQVTSVRRNKREVERYQYDPTGNVTQALTMLREVKDAAWQGIREISVGGRLRRAGQIEYQYDADGRVVEKRIQSPERIERWRYDWTSEGRLRSVVNPKGERWSYRYDAFGRRVEKIGASGSTRYVWDGAVIIEEISDTGESKHWTYEENTFRPLTKTQNGQVFTAVNDQSGKPLELFNQVGEAAWRQQTNLWSANISEQTSQTDCDLRFQGQWFDEESGLHYNFHRYYDPQTARYISNDPIGLDGGSNTYGYVHNPLVWIDPLGLDNVSTGAGRDHVTYQGIKGGKAYTGYASAPSSLGLTPAEIVSRRYNGDFSRFGGTAPTPVYSGSGVQGKRVARGLEQHYFEQDVNRLGRQNVANRQNPVGETNPRRGLYERAKNSHLRGCK